MKKGLFFIILSTLALLSMGCIETETIITLKADGSGTLQETVLLSNAIRKSMEQMFQGLVDESTDSSGNQNKNDFNLFKPEELKEKAKGMGEGVMLVSSQEYASETAQGYRVVYSFKDINKLMINQNPGERMPSGSPKESKKSVKEMVHFKFQKGDVATLTIKRPKSKEEAKEKKKSASHKEDKPQQQDMEMPQEGLEQVKQMFGGMRIALILNIDGSLVETNATHVEGNQITVMDMDFSKLVEMPEAFKDFARFNPKTVEEAKALVKKVPGIKVDLNDEIVIKLKKQ